MNVDFFLMGFLDLAEVSDWAWGMQYIEHSVHKKTFLACLYAAVHKFHDGTETYYG